MECKFDEEVQFIQVDYYKPDSLEAPEIAVSCEQNSCDPNAKFADMLKVRGSPSKQLLTLTLHGVPQEHAGKYRCQAQTVVNPQKKSDEYEKPPRDEESPEQETPLVTGEKENLRKSVELDENEKVEEEAVELEEEGKTTNENAEEPLIKEEKEEKHSDDNEEEEDDKEKAEEGNDSSSEQKDGDITEATPGNRSEKAPIIATDQSAAQ
ncbi:hypothetical protein C0Q70_15033 [Pomacea canaliculata]|uniref:Uncharacterized protein n=1 Tax=Pomacea canaliculata TaxID=400727 RepID=A0A2T7NTN9_POMCA|nr:hypothetical protein C0Q70_15033 [Pomacea canaliculata]